MTHYFLYDLHYNFCSKHNEMEKLGHLPSEIKESVQKHTFECVGGTQVCLNLKKNLNLKYEVEEHPIEALLTAEHCDDSSPDAEP